MTSTTQDRIDTVAHNLVDAGVLLNVSCMVEALLSTDTESFGGYSVYELWYITGSDDDEVPEALEFWAVDEHLANLLQGHDERVLKNYMGMNIWGRTTSGQAIYIDAVIQCIAEQLVEM